MNQNTGFISGQGLSGSILKTTDAGLTWTTIYENVGAVKGIHFIDENNGFAILLNSVLKTVNGGTDWTETLLENDGLLLDVFFVNQNVGYVSGFMGDFYKTTDGGENWIKLPTQFSYSLLSMYFVDENTGYVCGDGYTFFQTDNGGLNWTRLDYFSNNWSNSVWFTDDLNGYIVGGNGKILKTTNGGLVFSEAHPLKESKISLFPNPANSTITINTADIANGLPVDITVLSCNGMQVMKRKYRNMPVQMDISALSTGIYLLRIETANTVEVRKLVKM
ncbi:MAG: T9SS type A sorting domain-containing protein [Bacteroidales bacterium]|nr:T9SS type A sorting domain-containing protein [Bacteroidales bacterium]